MERLRERRIELGMGHGVAGGWARRSWARPPGRKEWQGREESGPKAR